MTSSSIPPMAALGTLKSPGVWQLEELRGAEGSVMAQPDHPDNAAVAAAILLAEQERVTTEAYEAGYLAGQLASASAAETQMRGAIDALKTAAVQITTSEINALGVLEDNLAALAVSIARHIIGREVRTAPDVVVDLVRLALTEFPVDQPLRIRINPLDLSTLAAATGGAAIRIAPDREVSWIADARVLSGGCVVEGRERIIDGRVDTALERAYRALTQPGA